MPAGTKTDFKIYNDQIQGGMIETLVQNTAAFNAASGGAIVMRTNRKQGEFDFESFFQNTADLVSRRDPSSVAAAADTKITQGELVRVKLNRRIGPVAQTLDAFRKIGSQANVNSLSFLIGTQIAKTQMAGWLNDGLLATRAALAAQATNLEADTAATITTTGLVDALAKYGDAANRIGLWVMHSKVFYDLVKEQIGLNITNVSNFNIAQASPITLNRPVLVSDSPSLVVADGVSAGVDAYYTLGLSPSSLVLEDSEEELIHAEIQTGLENLVVRIQGEYAYNMGIKGFAWDTVNGGVNPDAAALGTGSNWDKIMTDPKDLAGVVLSTR
jgi:hypothetical protein